MLATDWDATKHNLAGAPLPPCGHPLYEYRERGNDVEVI